MAEIAIKIGDSGSYRDGQVISIKPNGWLIPPAEMVTWIRAGTEPAMLTPMPRYLQGILRRRINKVRHDLTGPDGPFKEEAQRDQARLEANGYDTNWGSEDLKVHFVLRIADITMDEQKEMLDPEWSPGDLDPIVAKRRYRVDYASLYTPKQLADIRDTSKRVEAARAVAQPKNVVVGTTVASL